MNLTIIGSGYVGLTTGTCFAEMGHHVICVDNNAEKIRTLQSGSIPIYEPKLEELVKKNVAVGRLEFSPSIADSIAESEVIFIAVPTPPNTDGSVDLTYIEKRGPGNRPGAPTGNGLQGHCGQIHRTRQNR